VRPVHARVPHLAFGHCCEAVHSAVFPQPAEETQVPHAVLTAARSSAWTKGPEKELIAAVVAMNPNRSCHGIAQQIALAFGVEIDKNVVCRILSVHHGPDSGSQGPSSLSFLGHTKDEMAANSRFFNATSANVSGRPPHHRTPILTALLERLR